MGLFSPKPSGRRMSRRSKTRKPPEGGDLFPPRYVVLGVCGFLLLAVAVVFGQTLKHGFINFDDGPYVYENPHVTRGLTADGIAWAFTTTHAANWHPLTWLSHMLDCQLYGLRPGGTISVNVVLHAATAVAALPDAAANDGRSLAQRAGGRRLRHPPPAGRIGGLGDRTEGRS